MTAESSRAETPAPPQTARPVLVFWGLMLGLLLSTLDQSIIAAALPSVVSELGGLDSFTWVIIGYGLALSVTTAICGKLGDLFGHKKIFIGAVVVFVIGSSLCGIAGSMSQLIIFRVVQGIGGGGLVVSAFSLVGTLFGPQDRPRYQGYTTTVFAVASIAGPLAGGLITDGLGWRWTFYVNVPIGAAALAVVGTLLVARRPEGKARIDFAGAALLAGVAVCLALVASWAGSRYPWSSPVVLSLLAGAVVMIVLWVLVERRAAQPIIPPSLFRSPTFTFANGVTFLAGFAILATVNFLPIFLQAASGASATVSGLLLAPMMFGLVAASTYTGKTVGKLGTYRWFPPVSMAVAALAAVLLSTMTADTSWLLVILYSVVLGVGSGLSMPVFMIAVQGAAPPRHIGAATASVTFSRLVGAAFGVSVFGSVFASRFSTALPEHVHGAPASLQAVDDISAKALDALPPDVRSGFTAAYADSLSAVFFTAVPVLVVALLLSLGMRDAKPKAEG